MNRDVTQLSRRQLLRVGGGIVGVATLVACALPVDHPQTANEATETPVTPTRELLFWGHEQHPLDVAASGFVELHPEISWVSPHPADRSEAIKAAMAAGSGAPDLYWATVTETQGWGCAELLTDLTDHLKPEIDQYHPAKIAETFVPQRGKYVGWPGDISVSGWYYRQDKLEEAGYAALDPNSLAWPDFLSLAVELKGKQMYSFCFPASGWSALFFFALYQLGGTAISQDGQTLTVGDEKGIAAMHTVKSLWDSGGGLAVDWWRAPYWDALTQGTLVADFAAAWAKGFWEANLKDVEDNSAFGNWRIAKFPRGDGIKYRTGVWGGALLVNPKASANPEDAILFMQYALGSIEGAALCGEWGIIPAFRPYLRSEKFLTQKSPIFGDWEFCKFWAEQEKELSPEFFRPAGWDAVEQVVGREMVPILTGEYSVEEGMARIVEIATPAFEQTHCV